MRRLPNRKLIIYLFTILLFFIIHFYGKRDRATNGLTYQSSSTDGYYVKSEVTQILEVIPVEDEIGDNDGEKYQI